MKLALTRSRHLIVTRRLLIVAASILVILSSACAIYLLRPHSDAYASMAGFSAGNIMDDAVMANENTMNTAQIQAFLKSKDTCDSNPVNPAAAGVSVNSAGTLGTGTWGGITYHYYMKGGQFVCMADQSFNGQSAAQIIYNAAQTYDINPQVLIVILQKEQGLVTDGWPNYDHEYAAAMGYACPDSGTGCSSQYAGFQTQIMSAAQMLHTLLQGQGTNNYPIGNDTILYNPSASCGSSVVNVQNLATGALYTYTPYQPNAAAIAAPIGTTVPCGAYGNRNFYDYFTSWFGSTHYTTHGAIGEKYTALGGLNTVGTVLSNEIAASNSGVYQLFQTGRIYWTSRTGAWYVHGGILSKYLSFGGDSGLLGYPTSDEITIPSGVYQQYQGGRIYWTSQNGAFVVHGGVYGQYMGSGADSGALGIPTSDEIGVTNGVYQQFQNGNIYWSSSTGASSVTGMILTEYQSLQASGGTLMFPIGDATTTSTGTTQRFQGGGIYTSGSQVYVTHGGIGNRYNAVGGTSGYLGLPTSNETSVTGGVYQQFQNGQIYWSSATNAWDVHGAVLDRYLALGGSDGYLGFPTSNELSISGGVYQQFQNGRIYWSSRTKAWDIHGGIQSTYFDLGAERSKLGYPTSGEIANTSPETGVYQTFSGGTITWQNSKSVQVTYTK